MTLNLSTIALTVDAEGIALLSLNVPDRSMNLLTPALIVDLTNILEHIASTASIRGAIVTSGKGNSFLAGADLTELAATYRPGLTMAEAAAPSYKLSTLFRRIETSGKPFVAAINGLALGGGLELCLACHYRVISDKPRTVVGLPEVTVGLLPGAGGTQRLPRLIGIAAALPLLLDGRPVSGLRAKELGIVDAIAPENELLSLARAWLLGKPTAAQPWDTKGFRIPGGAGPLAAHALQSFAAGSALATGGGGRNYPAPLAILSTVYEGTQVAFESALRIESKYFGKLLASPVAHNLMRTLFINKGLAEKLTARPQKPPKVRVSRIGIIGAGLMGTGIARVSAEAGIHVILLDSTLEKAEQGKAHIAAQLATELTKGKTTEAKVSAILTLISTAEQFSDLGAVDLIVEAAFEDRAVKVDILKRAESVVPPTIVFASNTSTLSITGLGEAAARPANVIGLHFFSPVERMPLVEVIMGSETSEASLAAALDYIGLLRKTPIVVRDSPGFFTSRVFSTYVQEGLRMLEEGIMPALIENAAKFAGFPVGPLAVSDEVSLALQQAILKQQALDNIPERLQIRIGERVIDRMVDDLKRPGRKSGGGFYDYPVGGVKRLWPGLSKAFPTADRQPSVAQLQQRFLTIMALESARCYEQGILGAPADADLGSILGIGYPSWTGGTLSYIDTQGVDIFAADCRGLAEKLGARFAPSEWLLARARQRLSFYPAQAPA